MPEVSDKFWQCALELQQFPDVDWKLSQFSEIAGVAFLDCKMPLKIPRFACNICQNLHESPRIVLTKCESLYPGQLAQETWGCTLHTFLPTTTTEKYLQSYRPYREKIWGIDLVIGYRAATEKCSQTIILVMIWAATVFLLPVYSYNHMNFSHANYVCN